MSAKTYRVALVGTFDYKNYGDLLFPVVFQNEMDRLGLELELVLFSPVGGMKPFTENVPVYPVRELDRIHGEKALDAIVIGGGDLVRMDASVVADQGKYDDRGRVTDLWVLPILFGALHHLPVFFNAPGVPFDFGEGAVKTVVSRLLGRLDYLSVRDETSAQALRRVDRALPLHVVPDTVSCVDACFTARQLEQAYAQVARANALPERFALFQLSGLERGMTAQDYAPELKRLQEALGCPIVFMPIGYVHSDTEVMAHVAEACGGYQVITGELSPLEMYSLIGHARCFIGTSMHGGLTAMLQQVPAVAINYADLKKIRGCYACYGMEANVCASIRDITGDMLGRCPDRATVEELQQRIRAHMAIIAEGVRRGSRHEAGGECSLLALLMEQLPAVDPRDGQQTVYFDCGAGFSEAHVRHFPGWTDQGHIQLHLELPEGCKAVRFDPVEGKALVVTRLSVTTPCGAVKPQRSNCVRLEGADVFFNRDPWYVIPLEEETRELTLELHGYVLDEQGLLETIPVLERGHRAAQDKVRGELKAVRTEKDALRTEMDALRTELETYRREYVAAIAQRDGYIGRVQKLELDIQAIHTSFSWRLTAPMRAVTGRLRKMPHVVLVVRALRHLRRYGVRSTWARVKSHRALVRRRKAALAWEKQWREERGVLAPPPAFGCAQEDYEAQRAKKFAKNVKFSILVPLYNTPEQFLREMIASVQHQTYQNWELCLADGSDAEHADVGRICRELAARDGRIKYRKLEKNLGISGNTNACIDMSTGDYIALFDHDDLLHPSALYEDMLAICEQGADFIYTDENTFHDTPRDAYCPHFKPDFAPDTLRANNYICHFTVFSRDLLEKAGPFRPECDGSQDFDMVLRLTERARKIVHIPKILYYWRAHKASVASDVGAKPYVIEAAHRAVSDHLKRIGLPGQVLDSAVPSMYRLKYDIPKKALVSIVICTKDHIDDLKKCVDSILAKTTYPNYEILIVENNSTEPETFAYYRQLERDERIRVVTWESPNREFNYSAINNFGVAQAKGKYVLLLNNDTEVISPEWLEEMVMYAQRSDVGAVGVKLYYPDDTVQHAGIGIGLLTLAGHYHRGFPRQHPGYMGRLSYAQDVSAVTAACVMLRREVWDQVGGLDETFKVAFNDVDLCMRIRQAGYLIIFTPFAELYHYESKSRGLDEAPEKRARFLGEVERFQTRWAKELAEGDPYYNPNFSLDKEDFSIREEALL